MSCLNVWSSATSRNTSAILAACWLQTALAYIPCKYLDLLRHTSLVLPAVSGGQGEKHTLAPAKQGEPCAQHSRGKCCFLNPVPLAAYIIIIVSIMTAFACDAGKLLPQPLRAAVPKHCGWAVIWKAVCFHICVFLPSSTITALCVSLETAASTITGAREGQHPASLHPFLTWSKRERLCPHFHPPTSSTEKLCTACAAQKCVLKLWQRRVERNGYKQTGSECHPMP